MPFTPLSVSLFIKSSDNPLLFPTEKLDSGKGKEERDGGQRAAPHGNTENCPLSLSTTPSTAFYPNISHHRPLLWLAKLAYSSPSDLKKQNHFLASNIQLLPMYPPNSGGHIFLCLRDTPPVWETCSPFGALIFSQAAGVRHPGFFLLPTLVKRSTVVNQFIKHFPSVPLVCLQMQHLSTYSVLRYAAVRELNTVPAAMFKSRVWPPAFWEWPDHCAEKKSCDAPPILHAELSPPFFSLLSWPLLLGQLSCLKQPKVLCASHMEISRERQLTPAALPKFFLILFCLAWGAIPGLGKWRIRKKHLKYIKARWSIPLCN